MTAPDNLFDISGKRILVTGAARGNGEAIAAGLLRAGAHVSFADVNPMVEETVGQYENGNARAVVLDMTDKKSVDAFLAGTEPFDVLVANAGITRPFSFEDSYWDDTIEVNLSASYRLMLQVAEGMKSIGGGSIIGITSISAHLGSAGNPAYHASKGGLRAVMKGLAADLGAFNIRVNSICPGYIRTAMTSLSYDQEDRRQLIAERTMLGRWGESSDLVGACQFLASAASSYVTGSDIFVDGGMVHRGL